MMSITRRYLNGKLWILTFVVCLFYLSAENLRKNLGVTQEHSSATATSHQGYITVTTRPPTKPINRTEFPFVLVGDVTPLDEAKTRKRAVQKLFRRQALDWRNHIVRMNYSTLDMESVQPVEITSAQDSKTCSVLYDPTIIASNVGMLRRSNDDLKMATLDVGPGGNWSPHPQNCTTHTTLALVIPFRDRHQHLENFLAYIIPVLKSQNLNFRIILTEQLGNDTFNKGRIMNAAFEFVMRLNPQVNCVIFHDVDLMPQSAAHPYDCLESPRHLAAFFDGKKFKLLYSYLLGGVVAITPSEFNEVNGFSSLYWGWGGEDDDFGLRVERGAKLKIHRPPNNSPPYRYLMLRHKSRFDRHRKTKDLFALVDSSQYRYQNDGYRQHMWKTIDVTVKPAFYHLVVDVGTSPV